MTRRDPVASQLPREIYLEVTNRCNSRCATCIRTFETLEPLRDMTLAELQAIVDQFPVLERVVLHGIGEPLLNDQLPGMIRHIKAQWPSAVVLFNSNAMALDQRWQTELLESGLDELRISLDGATPGTYAAIRGVDRLGDVVSNVRSFACRLGPAGRPRLSIWVTLMRENLHELEDLVDLAADTGVPEVYVQRLVLFGRGLARDEQSLHRRLRVEEEVVLTEAAARAASHGLAFRASGLAAPGESLKGSPQSDRPWSACYRPWTSTYVTANGNVLPCCISPFSTENYSELILGNVFETPFPAIWNGEKYIARRSALSTARPLHPCELCGVQWSL